MVEMSRRRLSGQRRRLLSNDGPLDSDGELFLYCIACDASLLLVLSVVEF
jgi:hypothetical protein